MAPPHTSRGVVALLISVFLHIAAYAVFLMLPPKQIMPSAPQKPSLNISLKPTQLKQANPLQSEPPNSQLAETETPPLAPQANEPKRQALQNNKTPQQTVKHAPTTPTASTSPSASTTPSAASAPFSSRALIDTFKAQQKKTRPAMPPKDSGAENIFSPTMRQTLKDTQKFRKTRRGQTESLSQYKLANQSTYVSLGKGRCFEVRQNPKWGEQQTWWPVNCREQAPKLDIKLDTNNP